MDSFVYNVLRIARTSESSRVVMSHAAQQELWSLCYENRNERVRVRPVDCSWQSDDWCASSWTHTRSVQLSLSFVFQFFSSHFSVPFLIRPIFFFSLSLSLHAESTSDVVEGTYGHRTERLIYGVFTTPENSIYGSAVCAFRLQDVMDSFEGAFKVHKKRKLKKRD